YDFRKKQLLLAKDRMGKKPLYYSVAGDTIVFASELKAIIQHPNISRELNLDVLNEYLTFDYIPTPHTIFKNIYKLEASDFLIFKEGKIGVNQPYWQINFTEQSISFADAATKLDSILNNAVKSR